MAVAVCVGVLALLPGCEREQPEEPEQANIAEAALSPGERQDVAALAVSAEQLPPLRRTTDQLSRDDVVAQAALPDLEQTLDAAGFRGGVKVEYRGVSPRLTGVESQVLAFSSQEGAAKFSKYLAQHAAAFFGDPIEVQPIVVGDLAGWRIDPPVCDCAGAQPLSAGAVHVGANVVVLQITGPKADPKMVQGLLSASLHTNP
ncbi:MAG: hypothetical protein LH645_07535 [Actinomycetia bacterium]|nr:hypothetical protein [Actinomycetes bacterium]